MRDGDTFLVQDLGPAVIFVPARCQDNRGVINLMQRHKVSDVNLYLPLVVWDDAVRLVSFIEETHSVVPGTVGGEEDLLFGDRALLEKQIAVWIGHIYADDGIERRPHVHQILHCERDANLCGHGFLILVREQGVP